MKASSFPVFRKDLRSLMKPLAAFLVLQAIYVVGALFVIRYFERSWPPISAVGEIVVLSAISFGQIFGLVAAGYVFAEESTAGTDLFLGRLPASRARITAEKVAAGLAVLALLWAVQAAYHVMALPFGGLWSGGPSPVGILEELMSWITSPATVAVTLLVYCFGSYLVGVLVSLVTHQTLVIVVVGYALETIVFGFAMMGVDDALFITWDMAWLNLIVYAPLILVPLFVAMPGSRFRIPGAASLLSPRHAPIGGLVWKSITENSALQMLALVFLLGAFLAPLDVDLGLVTGGALLLLVALGTASYSPVEKQGIDCVLYQHPVPRHHLFWSKTGAAVAPLLAVTAGTLVFWSRQASPEVLTVLAYSGFAYACAVLMTLTFERPVIALLAAVSVVVTSLLIPLLLIEFMATVADVDITTAGVSVLHRPSGVPGGEAVVTILRLVIPAALLAAGSLWIAWRMANSAEVLTGTPRYRLRYFASRYSVIVAVTFVVTLLSWRERLAMIG
jgi:ABC-type transport system involved in multi-copper enzyme maturation permease subunit